ncbi:MAG: homoserine dehydrogenase [Calditrichaceae bacterium]|nr:homoserine dehydrogenase [Calditrichaceae bacterium]MBN2708298.1 homoserine dehydrogenase [Calditrichaceae bacterium]RQV91940.1 MAG: homoserine dehydrogenase [Calditrichota bacterium]
MPKIKKINFALLGLGKLGTGIYELWQQKRDAIHKETGWDLHLKKILVKNIKFRRSSVIDKSLLTSRLDDILEDDSIKIAIDAIGGIEPTFSIIKKLINNKINIISANRTLLASKMHELIKLANTNKTYIMPEPSLGGGVPIISTLQRDLVANKIKSLTGILSGTSNYILSEMSDKKCSLKEVLQQRNLQKMSESLSIIDYEGSDAAQKVSILAASSFSVYVNYLHIHAEGISQITPIDIHHAEKFGYEFKLLAIIKEHEKLFEIRVHPSMVRKGHPLTLVRGEYNAFFMETDLLGNYMLYGKGVGIEATSSLVLRDIISLSNLIYNTKRRIDYSINSKNKPIMTMDDIKSSYYVRFTCEDKPGVIGQITSIFGDFNINISSAHAEIDEEFGPENAGYVHIFIDHAREKDVMLALDKIQQLTIMQNKIKYFRIFP